MLTRCKNLSALFDGSVSCLCWAHNEELLVENFLYRLNGLLKEAVRDYEIIISDDGSTDRTKEIVKSVQKTIPEIKLIENEKRNFGNTIRRAIQAATKDYVFWQTVDWSYDISQLRIFLELLKEYDVVAGVRPRPVPEARLRYPRLMRVLNLVSVGHLAKRSDNLRKAIVSVANYLLVRFLFQIHISDCQNVAFYRRGFLQSIRIESNSSFLNPEFLLKAYWRRARIVEVPISFIPRSVGESKGTRFRSILKSVAEIFGFWIKWMVLNKREFRGYGSIKRLDLSEWEKGEKSNPNQ